MFCFACLGGWDVLLCLCLGWLGCFVLPAWDGGVRFREASLYVLYYYHDCYHHSYLGPGISIDMGLSYQLIIN